MLLKKKKEDRFAKTIISKGCASVSGRNRPPYRSSKGTAVGERPAAFSSSSRLRILIPHGVVSFLIAPCSQKALVLDLPGFYYDVDKNRYFPIKGPIPGSKRPPVSPSFSCSSSKRATNGECSNPYQVDCDFFFLDQMREFAPHKCVVFVWKYQNTVGVSDGALEQLHGIVQTPKGLQLQKILTMGSMTGYIR
ncbi:hypothetical protein GW17_00047197 [Ensete ventricosum]|nr:hypothetical protein GW17_00047197 [Ensete ventricosum]